MKLPILFLLAAMLARPLCAQKIDSVFAYFDKDWRGVKDTKDAAFFRTVEDKGGFMLVRDYFMSGTLQKVAECTGTSLQFNGRCVKYFANGKIQSEGMYKGNMMVGVHKENYENGKPQSEIDYRDKTKIYIHYYTEGGEDLLRQGKGLIKFSGETVDRYEEVRDSVLLSQYEVDKVTSDTSYVAVEKTAEYEGGYGALAGEVQRLLKYPKRARKNGVEGTVFVSFWVDKNGVVTKAYVLKGLDADCDAAALATVNSLKNWTPGKSNGHPARTRFVLPVKFNLSR